MGITLDRPHIYDNTQSLIIEISQCGASATGMTLYTTSLTGNRRTYNQTAGGCNYIYQGQGTQTANCGVDISTAVPSVNRCLLLPTPGVNINYVSIPYQASMVGFGNNITIEAWVKTGGSTTANTVLNKGAASFDYQLGINATTSNPFFRAGATVVLGNLITIPVNVWTHIAVVSNGTSVVFYVNGIAAQTLPTVTTLGSSTGEMRIGRGNADAGSGRIEELRLWSVARTATDINANKCIKWIPNNTTGLKAIWHFDSTYVDSVSGWNGTVMGTVGFDTVGFCPLVTYVPVTVTNVPDKYTLEQNYPNPFNPLTRINFSLPKNGFVSLKIYDVLGKEVAVLINENKNPGKYIVDFNATSLTSGVYFYKLEVNGFVSTKKMTLIK